MLPRSRQTAIGSMPNFRAWPTASGRRPAPCQVVSNRCWRSAGQNAFAALEMCDHAYLLEGGRIVLSGPGAEMIENEHVRKAYLGG